MTDFRNLKIMFLAGILGPGGAERQLFYLLRSLNLSGAEVSLLTLTKGQYWEAPIRRLGIPIYWGSKRSNRFARVWSVISCVNRARPDIIQSQHFYTNLYSAIAGRIARVKDIGAIRSNGAFEVKETGSILGWLSLYMPKYLAANSSVGKKFAELSGVPDHRLRLLPNVVDTCLFTPGQKKQVNRPIKLMLVSNLYLREKRVELFIQAIGCLMKKNNCQITALIVGDGPLKSQLKSIADEQGIHPGRLHFLGNINHIQDVYREADILVLTSDREGTPNVIMEAMASGLPVVATSVGGVPDLVQNGGTGFLVRAGDLDGLVEKLAVLIDNPRLRESMGVSGRDYILSHHSLERLPSILLDFYSSIL